MTGRPASIRIVAPLTLLLLFAASGTAAPPKSDGDDPELIQVVETHWGFDGTILPEFHAVCRTGAEYNRHSLGRDFVLSRMSGGKPVGCQLRRHVALGPEESRWIQFAPYIVDNLDSWQLAWGAGEFGSMDINSPNTGPRATVLIFDSDAAIPPGGKLRRMSEELFPQAITETSARASDPQSRPLLDGEPGNARFWNGLIRVDGSTLLLNNDGKYPVFPESLSVLNTEKDEFQVGAGNVKRVPIEVSDLELDQARSEIFLDDQPATFRERGRMANSAFVGSYRTVGYGRNDFAFRELSKISAFYRPWFWIYAAVLTYLFLQFPVCYRMG